MSAFSREGGLSVTIAGYGAPLFWLTQILRIVGCAAGDVLHGNWRRLAPV